MASGDAAPIPRTEAAGGRFAMLVRFGVHWMVMLETPHGQG